MEDFFSGFKFGEFSVPEGNGQENESLEIEAAAEKEVESVPQNGRGRTHRKTEVYELTPKFLYRRAFSESSMLDALKAPGFNFEYGHVYNFITGGDVDSLTMLKAVIRQQNLEYCMASTWCMGAEDILQFRKWVEDGKIKKLDMFVGEIFSGSYAVEYRMLKRLYRDYPDLGRIALFRNHSKIFAGYGDKFPFGIQSSANINTNPRTENMSITIDQGIYEFYRNYFDGIRSFE